MSYDYNKLTPSTIQYKKQNPIITTLSHVPLSIEQIESYSGSIVYFEDIAELCQNQRNVGLSQDQFNNYIFKICKSCHQSKKRFIAPFNSQLRQYLRGNTEYSKCMSIYVDLTLDSQNIHQFFFLYRQLAKQGKVGLILRTRDLFAIYRVTPFETFITQYKKSSKYIDQVILCDINSQEQSVMPFTGELFNINKLSDSIALFYYILKQSIMFVFDFKDQKGVFKNVILKFKLLELDLNDKILPVFNIILSSMYQDDELIQTITLSPEISLNVQQQTAINKYKARQGILSFLQSIYNQMTDKPLIIQQQYWRFRNVPNDLVRFLIATQIPDIVAQSNTIISSMSNQLPTTPLKQYNDPQIQVFGMLKALFKYAVEFEDLRETYQANQIQSLLLQKQKHLYTLDQATSILNVFKELIGSQISSKLKFIVVGALSRDEAVNITNIQLLMLDREFQQLIQGLEKLTNNNSCSIIILQANKKLQLRVQYKALDIPIDIYPYTPGNKGLMMIKYTSTRSFWNSLIKYLGNQLLVVKKNNLTHKNNQKIIPIIQEKQVFSILGLKYIEPAQRNSFQISDYYYKLQ